MTIPIYARNWSDVAQKYRDEAQNYLKASSPMPSTTETPSPGCSSGFSLLKLIPTLSFVDNSTRVNIGNNINNTNTVNNNSAPSDEEKKEKKFNTALFLAAIGVIFTSVVALGHCFDPFFEAQEKLSEKTKLLADAKSDALTVQRDPTPPLANTKNISAFAEHVLKVQKKETNRQTCYFAATLLSISGGASLLGGCFTVSPILVPTGTVLVIAGLSIALFTLARTSHHQKAMKEGFEEQQKLANEILGSEPSAI